ncbi:LacI family DNA-binding transcriptional regulator [Flavivirga spongiicola]|uniref:LacI family transcriptional regulator n=1 Tax=Flavivirga spongiicola TaxID=421621 RepID=A0ABU7XQN7_9FLAO|nr:LacI family DNA-binding transcriptional regulator [Flavivirga sp. MEBiC05379]MDO5977895.1 LacI family DNA-binding transcriptional regulator [Flavivirga sp. MEBiC05379]
MKKLYLKDIAKNLNVSTTAVSLVLNNKGDENKISQDTQQKILEYAKRHNYVANSLARGLSRGKSETIGLIIPNISDDHYAKIAGHIERKAKEYGYVVMYASSNKDPKNEAKLIQSMINRQVDGLILASTQHNSEDIELLKDNKLPFVLIDRLYPEIDTNYVVVDNFEGVQKATKHLLNLGRRKIGFVTLKPGLEAMRQRLLGYQEALKEFNIDPSDALVKELSNVDYKDEIKEALGELVRFPNSVDSIIFSTHYLTSLGLRELRRLNIKVPHEVAIVSFDELGAFDLVDPPITSIKQPGADIGDFSVDILMDEIQGNESGINKTRMLKPSLIIRKSCGAL